MMGLEHVSHLIARYYAVEKTYFGTSILGEQLSEALVRLYTAVLTYLARAKRYYTKHHIGKSGEPNYLYRSEGLCRCLGRSLKSVVQTDEMAVGSFLGKIKEQETHVDRIANAINAERE